MEAAAMVLDIPTIAIVYFYISFIQVLIMLFVFRIIKIYPGMNYLLFSCIFSAVCGLLYACQYGSRYGNLLVFFSNISFYFSILALNIGFSKFLDLPVAKKKLLLLSILFFAGYFWFSFVNVNKSYRIIVLCLVFAFASFQNSKILSSHTINSVRPATRLIAAACIPYGTFFTLRALLTFFKETQNYNFSTFFSFMSYFLSIAGILLWTYCFIVMTVQREHADRTYAEERFRLIFKTIPDTVFISELPTGKIIDVNETYTTLTGYTKEESLGKTTLDLKFWRDLGDRDQFFRIMEMDGSCKNLEITILTKDRKELNALISSQITRFQNSTYIISVIRDITSNKELTQKLKKSEDTFQAIMEQSPMSFILTNTSGEIEYANPTFLRLMGYDLEEVLGKNPRILKSGYHNKEFYHNLWNTILSGKQWSSEIVNKKRNGDFIWENIILTPILNEEGKIVQFLSTLEDISDRKRTEQELKIQARTDMLTGIMNRRSFMETANKRLLNIKEHGQTAAFLMIDIDRFKTINDSFGHNVGDRAICMVTEECQNLIKGQDLLGRIGGEEFAALVLGFSEEEIALAAELLCRRIEALEFYTENQERIPLRISVGVTFYHLDTDTLESLMERSDVALYQAKNAGRNQISVIY
jgi:diguanylate cyclase (GGDEF)-like protein/PAS domain S-box-containing protein